MTEQDRQIVIKRIEEDIENLELRKEILKRKKILEQDEKVKEYSYIINEMFNLDKKLSHITSKEDAINLEFIWAFKSRIDDENISPCNHPIWMYTGAYAEIYYETHKNSLDLSTFCVDVNSLGLTDAEKKDADGDDFDGSVIYKNNEFKYQSTECP